MAATLIIADNNELIREGLRSIAQRDPELQLVAECTNRTELKEAVAKLNPQVVVIDYSSDGFTIDVIPEILRSHPNTHFVALTFMQTGLSITNAIKSGILCYVKKDCDIKEITDSIKSAARGERFFCGAILETIKQESIDINSGDYKMLTCAPVILTERELEIIALIAEGYTNVEIAEKLFLSAHTINTHRKNIMNKLGVNNTAGIVMYAVKAQLVSPNKYLYSPQ
jgi:DNA-binding NarL/FixJ family response regulator